MKIIFLDHDGVICLPEQHGGRFKKQKKAGKTWADKDLPVELRFDNFDKKAVKVLNEILEKTGAEIIVSSDWRKHATVEELGEYYEQQGVIKKPIGYTELMNENHKGWKELGIVPEDFPWNRNDSLEQERHFEILRWLKEHPEVTQWIAIDDLSMGKMINVGWSKKSQLVEREWGLTNFFWANYWEGLKQCGAKDKIIKILNT